MPFEVISMKLTAQYTIDLGDYVYLDKDGAVTSSSTALYASHDGAIRLVIHGAVASGSTAVVLGDDPTSVNAMAVRVGETGTIDSIGSATGIYFNRNASDLINHGQISADFRGLMYAYNVESGTILNTGSITAHTSAGIYISGIPSSTSGTFSIVNSGWISGANGIKGRSQSIDLDNSGTIVSGIDSGDVAIELYSNTAGTNTLNVHNTGSIIGKAGVAIQGADAADTIVNKGEIWGDVDLGAGADTFDGRGGMLDGTVYGGSGDDTYIVDNTDISLSELMGEGTDTVKSTVGYKLQSEFEDLTLLGDDDIRGIGNDGGNILIGNIGDNRLRGNGGDDTISGGDGDDKIWGGIGVESIHGDAGDDIIHGGLNNDVIFGGEDDDVIYGNRQNDKLFGGFGNDRLVGGVGRDALFGGQGNDEFVFNHKNDSLNSNAADKIMDFVVGEDLIDLSGLAGSHSYIGSAAFSGAVGEVQSIASGGTTRVKVDLDGDGTADMKIMVLGTIGLTEADFLL
jgi:serralysin